MGKTFSRWISMAIEARAGKRGQGEGISKCSLSSSRLVFLSHGLEEEIADAIPSTLGRLYPVPLDGYRIYRIDYLGTRSDLFTTRRHGGRAA